MNTDTSSKAYIARFQSENIIAAVSMKTKPGTDYQESLLLGRIISILEGPILPLEAPILPPTDLSGENLRPGINVDVVIRWTNNAVGLIATIVETNTGSGWTTLITLVGGQTLYTDIPATFIGQIRVISVTAIGRSAPSNVITF